MSANIRHDEAMAPKLGPLSSINFTVGRRKGFDAEGLKILNEKTNAILKSSNTSLKTYRQLTISTLVLIEILCSR